ncbi:MAG: hypothetical protein JW940_31640 [Polyangiaceae bacterium]|nr:hypothetical protein [Polyangiaceae bacterium]
MDGDADTTAVSLEHRATTRAHLVAAFVAVGTSVLMTWPLAANAGRFVLRAIYFWDAYTNAMIMGSRVDAVLGRGPLSLYDNYYFAPLPRSIVFNENHFGLSVLFAPFYALTQNPLWAYNLTLLVSLALSVFFTYLLVLHLTRSGYAGIVAGVAFAFCPYALFEIGRIQLVATQWIPASFLFLHRAIERQRPRDSIAFWLCILLQIGTGLYYAMFLVPLLAVAGGVLLARHRPRLRFFYGFGAAAVGAGIVALLMVYPYFSAREAFDLERSLSYASSNDGKLSFFANVHPTNRTLTGMHHLVRAGAAHDEIAFPGFTALVLLLVAIVVPAWRALRRAGAKRAFPHVSHWLLLAFIATYVTLLSRSMLAGALVFGAGLWLFARRGAAHPFGGERGLYGAVLLVAVVMFLGIYPLEWDGAPVRGIYYYFHTYFPGFNGIRKVGRQAVMTTFAVCVLAGFGSAWVFSLLRRRGVRLLCSALLLGAMCYELRCFPHPIEPVWAGDEVPPVLGFVASLPSHDLIASVPQNTGRHRFRGDAGMALHNYLALYHKHRFVNGQSSWQPPVTELARRAVSQLPDEGARRALLSIGTRHIIVFGEDLGPRRQGLAQELAARPGEYRRIFQQGPHSVFTLLQKDERSVALLDTPALPPVAQRVPRSELRARSGLRPGRAHLALDGNERTYWTGGRFQQRGQYFEVDLSSPRPILALEIDDPGRVMDVPASFRLTASRGVENLGVVAEQPLLRFYRTQIFAPATFVFRVVLPQPILADRVVIAVDQPVPGSYFSIHELRLYDARP